MFLKRPKQSQGFKSRLGVCHGIHIQKLLPPQLLNKQDANDTVQDIIKAVVESHRYHATETIDDVVRGKGSYCRLRN